MYMKVSEGKTSKTKVIEYTSMNDFYKYICETPFNDSFRWADHYSVTSSANWTKTNNFEEAVQLMKNGWTDMSNKLTKELKVSEKNMQTVMKSKTTYGVAGYQAIVPLYLNGVPNNMASKKMVPIKQKVITLNKSINYSGSTDSDDIVKESLKAFKIVKKFEAQGYRCNLNVLLGASRSEANYILKIRVKNATEKLNVSKLAFPLVHPSMLRRLYLRWLEVFPGVPSSFVGSYGHPMSIDEMKDVVDFEKAEYILPAKITADVDNINTIDDLGRI